jgi:hypothetical protein
MHTQTIIEIDIHDQPGALGGLARFLATRGINIEGFSVEHNRVRFLTNDSERTVDCLRSAGFCADPVTVCAIEMENRPGALARVATALGSANVQIVNTFGVGGNERGTIYVRVNELEKATAALATLHGVRVAA